MPTATSINAWSLINLGPLTTTFTAAPSCSTQFQDILIGVNRTETDSSTTESPFLLGNLCDEDSSIGNCLPSGSAMDSMYNSWASHSDPRSNYWIDYYSPGLVCPSDYTTVGLATKLEGGAITSSGPAFAFPRSTVTPSGGNVEYNLDEYEDLKPNVVLEAMGPGETAILCCPSGFTADDDGSCSSLLPADYPIPSTACVLMGGDDDGEYVSGTVTAFGVTYTGDWFSETRSDPYPTTTLDLGPGVLSAFSATAYVAVSYHKVLYLVHAATDTASPGATSAASGVGGLAPVGIFLALLVAFSSGFLLLLA